MRVKDLQIFINVVTSIFGESDMTDLIFLNDGNATVVRK